MARILPYYSLCPLIEQKNFLGFVKDVDDDTAVVSINANIISRYKISDPKLLSSWNSKGSITSACIYDASNDRYIAIFNQNEIRIWTTADENIDKVKKYKFTEKLFKLLISPENGKVILVCFDGNVFYLDSVLENRKSTHDNQLISDTDRILSCDIYFLNSVVVIFLVEKKNMYQVLSVSPAEEKVVFDVNFKNPNSTRLMGHCLLVDKDCSLITLWSDGKLYRDFVYKDCDIPRNFCTIVDSIDLNQDIIMKKLSPYYIAICGPKDDGILLMIYSIKYNVIQCQQFYENCQALLQLWSFESKLFFIIGHNLVVVPYVQENRKLSTLIGSNVHQFSIEESEILPQAEIYKNVVPALLETNDVEGISNIFVSRCDIPDSALIDVLFWSLKNKSRKERFLDQILHNHIISDVDRLRRVFNVDLALTFLDYVMTNLSNSNNNVRLVKWISLFVDAFYSELIMSNNKAIVGKLKTYVDVLRRECEYLNSYKELATVMSCIKRKKQIFV